MSQFLKSFAKNESGATAIEYGLIAAGISVVIITAVGLIGGRVKATFDQYDTNRSGRLDYRELRNCLNALGIDVTGREAAEVLTSYDADGNGLMEL